ncbi:hypothetical protein KTD31_00410 [Burkholderia multivorans]|uniref:hypothetical protein n=1 Tax=Burkholderia multivorans TaxID=87883 RepID=UPI001C223137|nr:hypothetical protein [Burkholderia multivorans]MBU9199861.1 hypothetical protein [Burkholderia multivorans]MDN8079020.1 hypothetical protein [Burkholderia multivorans]
MQAIKESNGNVTFVLEGDDAEMVERFEAQAQRNVDHEVLASLLDHFGFLGNAVYMPIMPEDVGGLTDAPMFTDELEVLDDGTKNVTGKVWWYPNYQVKLFSEVLRTDGRVTFALSK